ncbi:MAG: hypothetical protein ACKVHP_14330, partial [Verrucomicrobiales bacterium]
MKIHLRLAHGVAAFLACTLLPLAADSWTAYNDLADTDPDNSPANITSFGFGRNYDGDGVDGELLD